MGSVSFLLPFASFCLLASTGLANMRSGRFPLGFGQFAAAWVLGDAALLLAFVLPGGERFLGPCILALELSAALAFTTFAFGRWRRGRPFFREARDREYRRALQAYMRGEDAEAARILRRIRRKDPWDAAVPFLLAEIADRGGRSGRSRRLRRTARRLAGNEAA